MRDGLITARDFADNYCADAIAAYVAQSIQAPEVLGTVVLCHGHCKPIQVLDTRGFWAAPSGMDASEHWQAV